VNHKVTWNKEVRKVIEMTMVDLLGGAIQDHQSRVVPGAYGLLSDQLWGEIVIEGLSLHAFLPE
jgi:hypothetical protein